MNDYTEINRQTINRWVREGWEWGTPLSHEDYVRALGGELLLKLTPTKLMPRDWFPRDLKGLRILGLCCGGGQQGPVFAAHGMDATILDYSDDQLGQERAVAQREGYAIRLVLADVTRPLPFADGEFDIVFNPVSLVYVRDILPVFAECARVLKRGGIFVAGLDNGINFLSNDEHTIDNEFPFDPLTNPALYEQMLQEDYGIQFSHSLAENIGGQLRAGLQLTDIYDDVNGEGRLHQLNIPTFFATRSVKP